MGINFQAQKHTFHTFCDKPVPLPLLAHHGPLKRYQQLLDGTELANYQSNKGFESIQLQVFGIASGWWTHKHPGEGPSKSTP
jgi:hypothetical protein